MAVVWSEKETEFLSDNAGILGFEELRSCLSAKHPLKKRRSKQAIKAHAKRKKIRFHDNFYSYSLLSQELGRARNSLRIYYKRGWIKGKKASWKSVYGKCPMIFIEEDIVKFLQERYYIFDYKKIPNKYFSNIVKECYA